MDVKLSSLINILNKNTYINIQFDNESIVVNAYSLNYLNSDLLESSIECIRLVEDTKTHETLTVVVLDY